MKSTKENHRPPNVTLFNVHKTLKTIAIALVLFSSGYAFATEKPSKKKVKSDIYRVVANYLSSPEIDLISDKDATVEFYINKNNRIVVTEIETNDYWLRREIKSRLDFEKVNPEFIDGKNQFRIQLKFTDQQ